MRLSKEQLNNATYKYPKIWTPDNLEYDTEVQ